MKSLFAVLALTGGILFIALFFLFVCLALSALPGWIFMLLWNFTVVSIFHWPALTFLKAWALWFLICIILAKLRVRK